LIEAKSHCEHGTWERWVEGNFEGSLRTAQAYMRVASRRGEVEELQAKAQGSAPLSLNAALTELSKPLISYEVKTIDLTKRAKETIDLATRFNKERAEETSYETAVEVTEVVEDFDNAIEPVNAENGQVPARPRGALEQLAEAGIDIPPPPVGKTHEAKVYDVLCNFRDTMLKMPSDPKKVARTQEHTPLGALATVDDFGN
jgi:hypothetical protein